jgi:hypothetical protein
MGRVNLGDARSPTVPASRLDSGSAERIHERTEQRDLVLGLVTAPGLPQDVAVRLKDRLLDELRARYPGTSWRVESRSEALAKSSGVDLVQLSRKLMLYQGWQLAVCLTDLPLTVGRRPVTAHASRSLGVGVISVAALGALAIQERLLAAMLSVIKVLLQGPDSGVGVDVERPRRVRAVLPKRLREARQLVTPVGRVDVPADDTVRFVTATGSGNLRQLLGVVRANRPWLLIVSLSRAMVGALGAGAFGLTSPPVWWIADALDAPRVFTMTFGSLLALSLTLIIGHRLWEHSPSPEARRRVNLINLATVLTVAIGLLTLYVGLLAVTITCAVAFIPSDVLARQIQHGVSAGDYLGIGVVVSSLATLGGALGAALESDLTVREAAFGYRATEETDVQGST